MNKKKIFLIVAAILLSIGNTFAQHNSPFQNKTGVAQDSASYPNVNTPNHNSTPPKINGTFDDPKIIPDSAGSNRDSRGRENPDSVRNRISVKPTENHLRKDTMH